MHAVFEKIFLKTFCENVFIYKNVRNRKNKSFCKFILYRTCLTKTTDEAGEAGARVAVNDVIARGPVLTRV